MVIEIIIITLFQFNFLAQKLRMLIIRRLVPRPLATVELF